VPEASLGAAVQRHVPEAGGGRAVGRSRGQLCSLELAQAGAGGPVGGPVQFAQAGADSSWAFPRAAGR
jgi:hypothetical protein